jgi:RNA polymerase sigma-70 factor (ECF subfamily)
MLEETQQRQLINSLVVKNYPKLIVSCQKIVGLYRYNKMSAEDLCNTVIIKILEVPSNFEPGSNFNGWFFKIAKNWLISFYRRTNNRTINLTDEEFSTLERVVKSDQEEHLDFMFLMQCLEQLPDNYLYTLLQVSVNNVLYKDLALEMGVLEGTLKAKVFRARDILQNMFDGTIKICKDKQMPTQSEIISNAIKRRNVLEENNEFVEYNHKPLAAIPHEPLASTPKEKPVIVNESVSGKVSIIENDNNFYTVAYNKINPILKLRPLFETDFGKRLAVFIENTKNLAKKLLDKDIDVLYTKNSIEIRANKNDVNRFVILGEPLNTALSLCIFVVDKDAIKDSKYPIAASRQTMINKVTSVLSAQQSILRVLFPDKANKININLFSSKYSEGNITMIDKENFKVNKKSEKTILNNQTSKENSKVYVTVNTPPTEIDTLSKMSVDPPIEEPIWPPDQKVSKPSVEQTISIDAYAINFNGSVITGKINLHNIKEIDHFISLLNIMKKVFDI